MKPCSTCGRELGPQARFCGSCGTPVAGPAPAPRAERHAAARTGPRPTAAIVVAATAVVVVAGGATIFALTRGTDAAPPATVVPATVPATAATTTARSSPSAPAGAVAAPATEADLRRQTAEDHAVAESLVGQWVPQLSSKRPGLVVGTVTYDYPAIVADFQSLRARFPGAVLVNSSDYANFSKKDFWVTLAATAFPTADAANTWCDEQNFAREDCHASRLTHTGGPAGNSKPR